MGFYDRDYQKDSEKGWKHYTSGGLFASIPPVTRYILIINLAVFLLMFIFPPLAKWIYNYFSVYPAGTGNALQIWRLATYQFIHADFFHIFFNMLMLIFLGPIMESHWGPRTYLRFYLISGAVGGVIYTLLAVLNVLPAGTMVGASGSIYGLMAAVAILYPAMQISIFGIIPMKLITLVAVTLIWSLLNLMSLKNNAGGEAAHLSGIAVGLFYVYLRPRMVVLRMNSKKGAWERKLKKEREFDIEVDRILKKIKDKGISSISGKERKILQEATRREKGVIESK